MHMPYATENRNTIQYEVPSCLEEDICRFERDLAEFKAGRLHEAAFAAKRVKMGVYLERSYATYMCRIRCAGGIVTPKQLSAAGALAQQFGEARVHVTTRAAIQLHGIRDEHLAFVLRRLKEVELSCQGGGGNTVRNIVASHDSGVSPEDVFDVQPCAVALTSRLVAEPDSWDLPRKIKTAFASRSADAAFALVQDVGFLACFGPNGERGYRMHVGGGLGARPKSGILLLEFVPEQKVYHAFRALKNLYHLLGNRKNKHRNRIKFLVHEELGEAEFRQLHQKEMDKVLAEGHPDLLVVPIDNAANLGRSFPLSPLSQPREGFAAWLQRNARPQRQTGLFSVSVPLLLGDLAPDDCRRLEEFLRPFGDNTLRCGTDQNLHVRNIPETFLPNLHATLDACSTLSDKPRLYGALVPCTGAQTCQVGINRPRPAAAKIFRALDQANFPLPDNVGIRISGCPNSCSNHWIGDLAFYGKVRHVHGRPVPTYNVLANGGIRAGELRLGEEVGWVHAFDLPRFVVEVLRLQTDGGGTDDFGSWWSSGGREAVSMLCTSRYNQIPSFEEDKNYYFDHGAEQIFSVKDMGRAECSAGMYDMIDVDDKAIRKHLRELEGWMPGHAVSDDVLADMMSRSVRMLLVTRGEEPRNNAEACDFFARHFIDAGLVASEHRLVVELARTGKTAELRSHAARVIALARTMSELYRNMDNTMRFPGETENLAVAMQQKAAARPLPSEPAPKAERRKADRFKDLSGVKCPLNFARTKAMLAGMQSGETLEIILDDGEPIENVPGSVRLDGHRILQQERDGNQWSVLIERK